ncbi:hypothetical protein BJ986_002461 [Phycicoccus badiiscoriae]|uniref:Lipoprotein n=1 Tax=Pedococcus badiiscoriae TaxID=642776 RepID=A0A852WME0_9MICO|nr:hypothetical protein [Pedococcus badiiscoriae]NYG07974.1 hypothetical protein [Pedococcus badiiscoriae]
MADQSRTRAGDARAKTIVILAAAAVAALSACSPKEPTMTPHESRDQTIRVVHETQKLLSAGPWRVDLGAYPEECTLSDGSTGVSYADAESAEPTADHIGDANRIADYWKTLGMSVRVVTQNPTAYATGGPLKGASFSTSPGLYSIEASSTCVPGNAANLLGELSG